VVAHVSQAGRTVDAQVAAPAAVLTWPGATAQRAFRPGRRLTDQAPRGSRVGTVEVTLATQHVAVPVRLGRDAPRPSFFQRLF
jgi:hypothetical protein